MWGGGSDSAQVFWLLERPAATNEKPLERDHLDQFFEISENYICIIHEEQFLQRSDIVLENISCWVELYSRLSRSLTHNQVESLFRESSIPGTPQLHKRLKKISLHQKAITSKTFGSNAQIDLLQKPDALPNQIYISYPSRYKTPLAQFVT